jgi:hypothetical protein
LGYKNGSGSEKLKAQDRKLVAHRSNRPFRNRLTGGCHDDHRRFYQPPQGIGQAISKTMVTMMSIASKSKIL